MKFNKVCPVCSKLFETVYVNQTTCCKTCSNRYFIRRISTRKKFKCINCGKEKTCHTSDNNKFCSNKCHKEYQYTTETLPKFNAGSIKDRHTISKILKKEHGNKCFCCNVTLWNNLPIKLEVDRVDGNASNDLPSNLRLLCPNCHSQTKSWKGGNRGNGRKALGLPLN